MTTLKENVKIFYVIKLLLITSFTNAKLEHVFSLMNQTKTESHNRLGQERLDTQICEGEEGVNIIEFNPDPHVEKRSANKV